MAGEELRQVVQAIIIAGGGGGPKTITNILDEAAIAAATETVLADCDALDLSGGVSSLALTVLARYNAAATAGIRVHVITSPADNMQGTHTPAAPSATILTDAAAHYVIDALIGLTVYNITDGSSGVITDNDETTITVAALAGGTLNVWTQADVSWVDGAGYDTEDWDTWTPWFAADGILRETKHYDWDPAYIKVLIENLDAAQAVTDVEVNATVGA